MSTKPDTPTGRSDRDHRAASRRMTSPARAIRAAWWSPDASAAHWRSARRGGIRWTAHQRIPPDRLEELLEQTPRQFRRRSLIVQTRIRSEAGEEDVVFKLCRLRPSHGVIERLRVSKAVREAAGYRAFAACGLPTPEVLGWGEQRRHGLWMWSFVLTERVMAPNLLMAHRERADAALLKDAARFVAATHRVRLAHGDPRLSNFLVTPQGLLTVDPSRWSRLTSITRAKDVVRFLGSVRCVGGDAALAEELLQTYEQAAEHRFGSLAPQILRRAESRLDRCEGRSDEPQAG